MIIFLRWLLGLFKKEHAVLIRYERSHHHFVRYMLLDAVISIAVVVAGYQLLFTHLSTAESKEPHEISVVSSNELTGRAKAENLDAFWLGPVTGYKYNLNDQESGIVDIFYWPVASGNSDVSAYLYEVKTYERQDVWNAHTHPIKANANTTTIKVNKIISIKINKSSMKGVIATFTDKPEVVAIAYPMPQTLNNMIKNVESLKLVR